MDSEAFRKYGKEMVDLVADYWDSMRDRQALPDVKPGYIWDMVPKEPPTEPEDWKKIFADIDPVVLTKNTNWHHPHFFAYFSTACSYPSIMADILSGGISSIGFSWKSSPSMTELEMVTTDWIAKAIGLPDVFLNSDPGSGAGVIQSTASDATFVAILSARARAVSAYKENNKLTWIYSAVSKALPKLPFKLRKDEKDEEDPVITFESHDASVISKLVGYCSEQAHSSVHKGMMLAGVKMRKLKTVIGGRFKNHYIEANVLEAAIQEDRARGLIPFIYVATVGTTNTCGADDLKVIGQICNREKIWMHVDAAYAGSFAICPELRYLLDGIELADSFNFNVHKALQINFDCSPMWFKDAKEATKYFNVEAEYLKHEYQAVTADYRHLQIALGRRFRSLKIWFVFRSLGIEYLQGTLRKRIELAEEFGELISKDPEFETIVPPHLGLVCFRHKSNNSFNEKLLASINDDFRIHLVGAKIDDVFFLRLAICSVETVSSDITFAYQKNVHEAEIEKELKNETLEKAEYYFMLGAPEVLQLCKNFIQLIKAKKVLDFGTFTGASAAAFSVALEDDGKVLSMDITHDFLDSIGMPIIEKYPEIKKKIEFRKGSAIEIVDELLKKGEAGKWDFAFIDADKQNYPIYYEKAVELIRPGGVIILDNALFFGTVVNDPDKDEMTRGIVKANEIASADPRTNSFVLNLADGVHIIFKK